VLGWDADQQLLEDAGVDVEALESGCCGLAGNFGFTAGHGEVSKALAEQVLLPRLRAAHPRTVTLADGFSCRTQIEQGDTGGRQGMHLAELVHAAMQGDPADGAYPEKAYTERPAVSRTARYGALAGAVASTGVGIYTAARLVRSDHD
jgi:hypothetical protein